MPLHQYFGSITVKVRWRRQASGWGCERAGETSADAKGWINAAGWTQWRVPAHLDTCRPCDWRQTAAVPLIVPRQQQYSGNATPLTVHEPATPFFQLQKMKTPGNTETIRGQDYDLWFLSCQGEREKKSNNKFHPLARRKNLFPKVSIQ